jgi:hypothetical protein
LNPPKKLQKLLHLPSAQAAGEHRDRAELSGHEEALESHGHDE